MALTTEGFWLLACPQPTRCRQKPSVRAPCLPMVRIHDYLHALRETVSHERYPLALEQLWMARRFLTDGRRRELEFAKDAADRLKLLDEWFGDFLTKEVRNTLALLAEERKLATLDEMRGEEAGEPVTITTARPLNQSLKEWFVKELGAARAIFKTDSSLIGGVKIRAGDRDVDNSLKAKLETIKMSNIQCQMSNLVLPTHNLS